VAYGGDIFGGIRNEDLGSETPKHRFHDRPGLFLSLSIFVFSSYCSRYFGRYLGASGVRIILTRYLFAQHHARGVTRDIEVDGGSLSHVPQTHGIIIMIILSAVFQRGRVEGKVKFAPANELMRTCAGRDSCYRVFRARLESS